MRPTIQSVGRFCRGTARLTAVGAVIVGALASFALLHPRRRTIAARARWLQRTCRAGLRALGVKCAAMGTPTGGAIVVSNHISYLDILVLAALTPTVFVAKREVRTWPVFGWLARLAGTRFVDREKRSDVARVAREFAPVLADGVNIALFLEGTSTDGSEVLPFKSSLLEPAVRGRWPVVPAAIGYAVPTGRSVAEEVAWWGDMTLAPHLRNLATLPWIQARVAWGEVTADLTDRKQLAVALHERVVKLRAGLVPRSAAVEHETRCELALVGNER